MEATRRYRLLLYFVALVLCLSACFAYAQETVSSEPTQQPRLLFQTSEARSVFMPRLNQTFVQTAAAPDGEATVSAVKLDQVSTSLRKPRGLWHAISVSRHKSNLIISRPLANVDAVASGCSNAVADFAVNDQKQQ